MQGDTSHSELDRFIGALTAGAADERFLDVRWRRPSARMRRRFVPATAIADAASLIRGLGRRADVYVGVALRDAATHGGRQAISASHLVWVESDNAQTAERLRAFTCQPSILIASGTPGHVQAYWLLDDSYPVDRVEAINRRLAYALGGDPGCSDIARILRPPGTFNHKHRPPQAVTLLAFRQDAQVSLTHLSRLLPADPDPPTWRATPARSRVGRTALDRELLSIPAAEYARVLADREPNREGKILCPFHADEHPSLQLYPDGGFYCFGSGCRRGGSIFDFAGHLWGIDPRGTRFLELRERLAKRFAVTDIPRR
jgi:hypothetical protein